jgi:hypothetical protein
MKPWLGPSLAVATGAVFMLSLLVLFAMPDRWEQATAIKICRDGTPILRLADGSIWARRSGFHAYRVEDAQTICG